MDLGADIDNATLAVSTNGASGSTRLSFSGDETFFQGHFPDGPVLPAVVQIAAVVRLAGKILGQDVALAEVTRAKFMAPTGPGRELTLTAELERVDEQRHRVKAVIRDGGQEVAELNLRVVPRK